MAPSNLNLTSLAASAVIPTSGNNYQVENLGFAHWLDNSFGNTNDGNPILSWQLDSPEATNQLWTYLSYPSSDGDTVFTLQSLSTIQGGGAIDGRGGYVRVDPSSNKLVQGGAPQAWKLIEVAPTIYKMSPFEDVFSENGKLVVTDVDGTITSPDANQAALQQDISSLQQFWTFN